MDAIVTGFNGTLSSVSATQNYLNHGSGSLESGGSRAAGSASNTMTGTIGSSDVWAVVGTDIMQVLTAPTVTTGSPLINDYTSVTGSGTITGTGGYTVTG